MKAWRRRAREEANLFNPAFCCATLSGAISNYSESGIALPLSFLVLPIVLHKPTREILPPNTRTSLPAWIQANPGARILFFDRLMSLKPHTREALQFGIACDWIRIQPSGSLMSPLKARHIDSIVRRLDDEARDCVMRARFIGKWLAAAGTPGTVLSLWGVRP